MLIDSNKLVLKRFRKSNSIGWGIIRDSYTTVNIIIGNTLRWYTNCPYSKQYYISKMIKMKQTLIVVCSSNIQLVIMCVKRHVITYTDVATVEILKLISANIKTQTEFSLSWEGRTYNNQHLWRSEWNSVSQSLKCSLNPHVGNLHIFDKLSRNQIFIVSSWRFEEQRSLLYCI
jgi:hypothetical protein